MKRLYLRNDTLFAMNALSLFFQLTIYGIAPIVGLLYFGWDWRQIIILYWLENITIGITTVINMLRAHTLGSFNRNNITNSGSSFLNNPSNFILIKIIMTSFFILHYGLFTLIHGVFVFALVAGNMDGLDITSSQNSLEVAPLISIWLAATIIQILRTVFVPDKVKPLSEEMYSPYGRILPLHITIIAGVWLISALHLPMAAAILLIILRIIIDLPKLKSVTQHQS